MRTLIIASFLAACGQPATAPDAPASTDDAPADTSAPAMLELAFCTVSDPTNLAAAYVATPTGDAVVYTCAQPCADWTQCTFTPMGANNQPMRSARGNVAMQGLAFVVDGIGGHFVFTPDGDDVVVTHAGSGGTSTFNVFDRALQAASSLKTVSLGWLPGYIGAFGSQSAGGWFSRKDGNGTSVRALAARPATAIRWVKEHLAVGVKLGTVGSSMGTIATFGAHVWYGLEPIIDYQMLIGGPGFWDVNAGCGRIHMSAGYCDVDLAPCTGNSSSHYGDDDPSCGASTNSCRVPTIMAPLGATGSAYDSVINYVGATTACAPTPGDSRDPSLDTSSLMTLGALSFHGRVDFVANEGGTQPPDADQGMGEGHMMYLYKAIQSEVGWVDNEGHHHGDAWDKDQTLIAAAAARVISGMGH